jgi:hypothetical protein
MVWQRVIIGMRRLFVAGTAVVVLIGGSTTYALVGRHASQEVAATKSANDGPRRVETARLLSVPISPPPAPDLIATKLIAEVAWPEVPKPAVKPKAPKTAVALKTKSKPRPTKKAASVAGSDAGQKLRDTALTSAVRNVR